MEDVSSAAERGGKGQALIIGREWERFEIVVWNGSVAWPDECAGIASCAEALFVCWQLGICNGASLPVSDALQGCSCLPQPTLPSSISFHKNCLRETGRGGEDPLSHHLAPSLVALLPLGGRQVLSCFLDAGVTGEGHTRASRLRMVLEARAELERSAELLPAALTPEGEAARSWAGWGLPVGLPVGLDARLLGLPVGLDARLLGQLAGSGVIK